MAEYRVHINWERKTDHFDYETYDRDHIWNFGNGETLRASSAPEYGGSPDCGNPEQGLVAALSSCHMLTFLAIASKKKIIVDYYEDDAVGVLGKNETGKLVLSDVMLKPKVGLQKEVSKEELEKMHEKAHANCIISNSVTCKIKIEPVY